MKTGGERRRQADGKGQTNLGEREREWAREREREAEREREGERVVKRAKKSE